MKTRSYMSGFILTVVIAVAALVSCNRADREEYTAEGVSKLLATYRFETISDVRYNLIFTIDTGKSTPVEGTVMIDFVRRSGREPLVLDFRVPGDHLR
ncbi:MAG TPA: hypothetical protein PKN60_09655, partial [Bacteroidales bacterium]|nr:hypothetical protein [Bacteroidales bacterium]